MTVFSDILISKVSEEVYPDWTVRTLKVERVIAHKHTQSRHYHISGKENSSRLKCRHQPETESCLNSLFTPQRECIV